MTEPSRPESVRPETSVEEPLFSVEQRRRIEALRVAKELRPQSAGAMFGSTPIEPRNYVTDLELLAEYIIDGIETAEVEEVHSGPSFEVHAMNLADAPAEIRDRVFGSIREHIARVEAETEKAKNPNEGTVERREATEEELERHAQKQDVSLRDAYSYFEGEGYDMGAVKHLEFDSSRPL